MRKSVIMNEYELDEFNPSDTILTMTPTESSRREVTDSQLEMSTKDLDRAVSGAG